MTISNPVLREHRLARAQGRGITHSNDRQHIREVSVYENEEIAREQRSTVHEEFEQDYYSELQVNVDGRTVVVEVTKR